MPRTTVFLPGKQTSLIAGGKKWLAAEQKMKRKFRLSYNWVSKKFLNADDFAWKHMAHMFAKFLHSYLNLLKSNLISFRKTELSCCRFCFRFCGLHMQIKEKVEENFVGRDFFLLWENTLSIKLIRGSDIFSSPSLSAETSSEIHNDTFWVLAWRDSSSDHRAERERERDSVRGMFLCPKTGTSERTWIRTWWAEMRGKMEGEI